MHPICLFNEHRRFEFFAQELKGTTVPSARVLTGSSTLTDAVPADATGRATGAARTEPKVAARRKKTVKNFCILNFVLLRVDFFSFS